MFTQTQANEKPHRLIPLDTLISKRSLSNLSLSPDGRFIALSGYPGGELKSEIIDATSGERIVVFQGKSLEEITLYSMLWIDNNSLYFKTYNRHAHSKFKTWILELQTAPHLQHELKRVNAPGYVIDTLPTEQDTVLFSAYKGRYRDKQKIYKTHTSALVRDNFKKQERFSYRLSDAHNYWTDSQNEIRFASIFDEEEYVTSHWYLDKNNDWQQYYEYDPTSYQFSPIGFLKNGKLAVLTNINSNYVSLFEFDVSNKKLGKLIYQHNQYDLSDVEYDKENSTLKSVSFMAMGTKQTEHFIDKDKHSYQLLERTFPNKQFDVISTSIDERIQLLKVYSADHSGQFYYFNRASKEAILIGEQDDFITQYPFATTKPLVTQSKQGHAIEALLTEPSKQINNNVLLVMPHGGPIGVRNAARFSSEVQFLANRGFSVLQINYRGSTGFGKEFLDSGRGQFGKFIEQDINEVVDNLLSKQTYQHICAIGASYGGYSSMMLTAQNAKRYACVVARFGVYDLPLIFNDRNTKRDEQSLKQWEKVVGKNDGNLVSTSPVYMSSKIKVPVLITAGEKDRRASFEHSNRMKLVLEAQNSDVEHIYYADAGHGHWLLSSARHELAYIDDFIRRKLNLPLPHGKNAKWVIGHEYLLLADGFSRKSLAGERPEKADFYRQKSENLLLE